jgi:hypothetical protein
MQYISFFILLTGLFITQLSYSQTSSQKKPSFVSPLDIPLYLSSNYGEYRSGHFHAGVDFKTQQVEGKNVFAVDSGYVYRIVVLSGSYGNALYIKHPSGYITLYGHLSRFTPAVDKYVKEQQYKKKSFSVDLAPDPGKFVFKKGQYIGLSGNSGASFGAHLHFEIRDESGSVPLNPLKFGFDVKDRTKPDILWLMIYAHDTGSFVNGNRQNVALKAKKTKDGYTVSPDTITVSGKVTLGIESYDFLDDTPNKCGPASIEVLVDNRREFFCSIDSVSFEAAGLINGYYDYGEMLRSGRKFQRLSIDPNNTLNIFKVAQNRGILDFNDSIKHAIRIIVSDTYGNKSELKFWLRPVPAPSNMPWKPDSNVVRRFYYDSLNVFENQNVMIAVPNNALYDNIDFQYSESKDSMSYSSVYHIHNQYTPLLSSYIIGIKPDNLPASLESKAYLASRVSKDSWVSQGGEFKNGFVTGKVRVFGDFTVAVDTVAPIVKPASFSARGRYQAGQTISFTIKDTLSGIQKYSGFIDKNWVLFEYDAKNDLLSYTIDKTRLPSGKQHTLEIIVTDRKGNVGKYGSTFYY